MLKTIFDTGSSNTWAYTEDAFEALTEYEKFENTFTGYDPAISTTSKLPSY